MLWRRGTEKEKELRQQHICFRLMIHYSEQVVTYEAGDRGSISSIGPGSEVKLASGMYEVVAHFCVFAIAPLSLRLGQGQAERCCRRLSSHEPAGAGGVCGLSWQTACLTCRVVAEKYLPRHVAFRLPAAFHFTLSINTRRCITFKSCIRSDAVATENMKVQSGPTAPRCILPA